MKDVILKTLLVVITFTGGIARAGAESGGGGGVYPVADSLILVDFYNIDSEFEDRTNFERWTATRLNLKSKKTLQITDENKEQIGQENEAFDLVFQVLDRWRAKPFDLVGLSVSIALKKPLVWKFSDEGLEAPPSHIPAAISDPEKIQIAAYYRRAFRTMEVSVDSNLWNKMGVLSQAGLILHEGLRHMQIGWSNQFDEESLQYATSILMMCEPSISLNYYLQYLTWNRRDIAENIYGKIDKVLAENCKRTL